MLDVVYPYRLEPARIADAALLAGMSHELVESGLRPAWDAARIAWRISRAATPRHRHSDGVTSGWLWLDPEVELVGVRAVRGDDDIHLAAQSLELTGAGIRHHGDRGDGLAPIHGGAVLQYEAATAPYERSGHALQGHIGGGTLHLGLGGQHFALADRLELAVKALVDGQPAQVCGPGDLRVRFLRRDFHLEGARDALTHVGGLLQVSPASASSAR